MRPHAEPSHRVSCYTNRESNHDGVVDHRNIFEQICLEEQLNGWQREEAVPTYEIIQSESAAVPTRAPARTWHDDDDEEEDEYDSDDDRTAVMPDESATGDSAPRQQRNAFMDGQTKSFSVGATKSVAESGLIQHAKPKLKMLRTVVMKAIPRAKVSPSRSPVRENAPPPQQVSARYYHGHHFSHARPYQHHVRRPSLSPSIRT